MPDNPDISTGFIALPWHWSEEPRSHGATVVIQFVRPGVTPSTVSDFLPVFNVTTYGAIGDGSTDNTTAVQNAINAAYSAGGGIVYVPQGTFVCTGQLSIPGSASAGQVPIIIRGASPGISMSNIQTSFPTAGSVLDLRYSGSNGKIIALNTGIFGLQNIRVGCSVTSGETTPIVFLTLPQPRFEDVVFFGNSTHTTTSCVQDAVVFGGTGTSHVEGSTSSPFSGYGGFVRKCGFWSIRKHVLCQNWVNNIVIEGNITDRSTCGSAETNSAPYVFDSSATDGSHEVMGNILAFNTIELQSYNYGWKLNNNATDNLIFGNGYWDPTGGTLGIGWLDESTCVRNWIRLDGYSHQSFQTITGITAGAGKNMVEHLSSQYCTFTNEYKPAGWTMYFNGNTNGHQSLAYNATIDGPLLSGNLGVGIQSAGAGQMAGLYAGSGTPNGTVTAAQGSVYFNTAGGSGTSFYVKEAGSGNTGWVGK